MHPLVFFNAYISKKLISLFNLLRILTIAVEGRGFSSQFNIVITADIFLSIMLCGCCYYQVRYVHIPN